MRAFQIPRGQRQLFLDDHGVAEVDKLTHTLHQPAKKGAVIRSPGVTVQTHNAPIWEPDEGRFALRATPLREGGESVYHSADGLHWIPGAVQNPPVNMAVYDGRDPDQQRRYKAALQNEGFAVSPDGLEWTKLDVPAIQSQDQSNFSYNAENGGQFIHTVKRPGTYGRSVAIAVSENFESWEDFGVVFQSDEEDQQRSYDIIGEYVEGPTAPLDIDIPDDSYEPWAWHNVDVYNMGVFRYEGLYIGMPAVYYRRGERYTRCIICFTEIQLTCSRDLQQWQRLGERKPFIRCSPHGSGAYDLSKNLPPSDAVVRGDELWFYYTGIKYHGSQRKVEPDQGAVCLATLRRDGFMSYDAGDTEGTLLTEPFTVPSERLFVNVDTYPFKDQWYWRYTAKSRDGGEDKPPEVPPGTLLVEVIDRDGEVAARSAPVQGDQPRAEVAWQEGNIAAHKDKEVRLRFRLQRGKLYSYWMN